MLLQDFFVFLGLLHFTNAGKTLTHCDSTCGIAPEPVEKRGYSRYKRDTDDNDSDEDSAHEGEDSVHEDEDYYDDSGDSNEIDDEHTRIVNGYNADKRPWLVFLSLNSGKCGGALINHKFVLTAAHCFCRGDPDDPHPDDLPCQTLVIDGLRTSAPTYPTEELVMIYVGVNDHKLNSLSHFPEMEYRAKNVKIRPGWVAAESFSPDLAIVELNRRIKDFVPNMVNPICVPPSEAFKDRPKDAFVGGWGAEKFACDTNDFGPNPHTMCKFPFVFKGQVYNKCSYSYTPATENPVCNQLFEWAKKNKLWSKRILTRKQLPQDTSVRVYYWNEMVDKAAYTTCYSPMAGQDGWCSTCKELRDEVDAGKQGYCDKYSRNTEKGNFQEYGRPTSKKDWGWCRDTCNKDPGLAEKLQETKLDILNPDECEDFDPVMQPNATHEICTGRKNPFPTVWLFKRTKSLETGRFSFKHIGKEKNYLGFKKSKHDFYLGGTDSCQGDSGGPLYQWFDTKNGERKAYLIGVVSRGTGCANHNSPGIFTRITKHLRWIKKNTRSGDCKKRTKKY